MRLTALKFLKAESHGQCTKLQTDILQRNFIWMKIHKLYKTFTGEMLELISKKLPFLIKVKFLCHTFETLSHYIFFVNIPTQIHCDVSAQRHILFVSELGQREKSVRSGNIEHVCIFVNVLQRKRFKWSYRCCNCVIKIPILYTYQ